MKRFELLIEKLNAFKTIIFEKWAVSVPETIVTNLEKSLITRVEDSKAIILNFDKELSAILREIHYLRLMGNDAIPESGIEFSENQEIYRSYVLNLEQSVEWYNDVRKKSSEVELKLIQQEIDLIDGLIDRGCNELNWNSAGNLKLNNSHYLDTILSFPTDITDYLNSLRKPVQCLYERMQKIQQNLADIKTVMTSWVRSPLFVRKDGRKDTVLSLDERQERTRTRYKEIEDTAKKIHE